MTPAEVSLDRQWHHQRNSEEGGGSNPGKPLPIDGTMPSRHKEPLHHHHSSPKLPSHCTHIAYREDLSFSNLLSIDESIRSYSPKIPAAPLGFRLSVRQHASHGLAVGDGIPHARGTRPIPLDPPIVCELAADDAAHDSLLSVLEISIRARLVYAHEPSVLVPTTPCGQPLLGDVDQSAFIAQVFPPREQSFFIFSELSIRPTGSFRLRFDVVDRSLSSFRALGSFYSRPFVVTEKRDFPGLSPSTDLILAIIDRGLRLRLVKHVDETKKKVGTTAAAGKKRARQSQGKSRMSAGAKAARRSDGEVDGFHHLFSSPSSSESESSTWNGAPAVPLYRLPPPHYAPPRDGFDGGHSAARPRRQLQMSPPLPPSARSSDLDSTLLGVDDARRLSPRQHRSAWTSPSSSTSPTSPHLVSYSRGGAGGSSSYNAPLGHAGASRYTADDPREWTSHYDHHQQHSHQPESPTPGEPPTRLPSIRHILEAAHGRREPITPRTLTSPVSPVVHHHEATRPQQQQTSWHSSPASASASADAQHAHAYAGPLPPPPPPQLVRSRASSDMLPPSSRRIPHTRNRANSSYPYPYHQWAQ